MAGTGDDAERVEQLPQSDWTDQDLLTKDEAHERLVQEISRTRTRLDEIRAGGESAEINLLERRLHAMESIDNEYNDYLGG
ncbi:hypothetical protein [Mycolicibacterium alvei]|uniref:Uncharacterized protein n=1 Tax=Mycolicibacterium alvei TaxID=67081 RepID=A0A6N4UXZ2_9MYCO|nr:hypothetical protein [Mycolicibacterium alvei]MCV7001567.1 hypothetical protein [Mycolicibacterium alvei]BBX28474.1 hypothetical protein MALV_35990 [Mycolicibacterium alvei]